MELERIHRLDTQKDLLGGSTLHAGASGGQNEKFIEMLKKNHDVVVEKYESYKCEYEKVRRENEDS